MPQIQEQETIEFTDYNPGHPSTQAIGKDVCYLAVSRADDVTYGSSAPRLNSAEVEFFKIHGYLIKRGLLPTGNEAFQQAIDWMWQKVPSQALQKSQPEGWVRSPDAHWNEMDKVRVGSMVGGSWKMRSPGEQGIGTENFLVNQIANHPNMLRVAEAFLGKAIKPVSRVRGIYSVFPHPDDQEGKLYPHGDYMASQLSAMVLLDDVPEHSGGFTVWPGSHQKMHLCWDGVSGSTISGDRIARYPQVRDRLLSETTPVEFTGRVGDVIFWHPRLIHSAGINDSGQSDNPMVRVLTPIDYQRAGETYVDDLEYGPGPKYQWWIDTRNVREDILATEFNIWHGWAI